MKSNKKITLNLLDGATQSIFQVVPLRRKRDWMTNTGGSFAYQCMPLNIANEFGWTVLNPLSFSAGWGGNRDPDGVKVLWHESPEDNGMFEYASSHFGEGTLTINLDFIIKTPPGISTYIRGIPNQYNDGFHYLDAIVETDWLPFTFTYNYQFQTTGSVTFEKEEPLFSFFPVERKEIEKYSLEFQPIDLDPKLAKGYDKYRNSREDILQNPSEKFQRFYRDAKDPDGIGYDAEDHSTKVILQKPKTFDE